MNNKNAEDLDIVMQRYNQLEYSQYYSSTSGNLWSYSRDEIDEDDVADDSSDGKWFDYKTKKLEKHLIIQEMHKQRNHSYCPWSR